jgi:hypothetical protein
MKRLLTGTFLLLFAIYSVTLVIERTSSWASTFAAEAGKSNTDQIGPNSSDAGQKRIVEHPFLVRLDRTPIALANSERHVSLLLFVVCANNANQTTPSRAPPMVL